ncbi:MAG: transposase, partial [Chloroflexi bacterium]|nr:transposase [Chloroflexota bacterium]MBI4789112.1 transposase [Chloroflexota bacterium]
LSLKVLATKLNKTLYEVKTDLLRDYLRAELRHPHVSAFQPA